MKPFAFVFAVAGLVAAVCYMRPGPASSAPPRDMLSREPLAPLQDGSENDSEAENAATADAQRLVVLKQNQQALKALEEQRYEDAVGLWRLALEQNPEDPMLRQNLSRGLGRWAAKESALGHHQMALDLLQEAEQVDADQGMPAYWSARVLLRLGKRAQAREVLQKALQQFPQQVGLLRLSAELAVVEGDMALAVAQMEQALTLAPDSESLRQRLQQLRAEEEMFRTFLTDSTSHFESRFDSQDAQMVQWIPELQRDLEDAWADVVQTLGIQPEHRILVLWLDPERYQGQAPDWSSGLYDGRVRIVVGDYPAEQETIRFTLRHELTHAALHTLGTPVPTWLHEGMAQIAEGRQVEMAREELRSRLPLRIQPEDLDANWTAWEDRDKVAQAYFYAMVFCDWLKQNYGPGVLINLFQNLRGMAWEDAWERTFGEDFVSVEGRYRRSWEKE